MTAAKMPRQRSATRMAAAVAAAAYLTLSLGGAANGAGHGAIRGRNAPAAGPHLPTVVNAPGTWSSTEGVSGPVAALGIATRTRPQGVFDDREGLAMFAVSALDGGATWLRLPGFSLERWGFVGGVAVSPDGRWIGWIRPLKPDRNGEARVAGWSVMDTTTGHTRMLDVRGHPWVRGTAADLAFSGDSRYLLTSYESPERPRDAGRGHQFVAWDVRDGTPTVVERRGYYWLPNLGLAPSTVTWARGRQVFRFDPETGDRTSVRLPQNVVVASWGPDDTSFAYVGRSSINSGRWRLHVGRTVADATRTVVDLPPDVVPGQVLGWQDARHVVVGHYRRIVDLIDVDTGRVEHIDMAGHGDQVNAPSLAAELWSRPLAAPAEPEGTTDPRRPWRWAGAAGGVAALVGFVRRRLREQPGPGH